MTFSQFVEHDITDQSNLVVKYGGRFLTWDNASPVLASLAVYRKSLVDHPEHHRHLEQSLNSKRMASSKGWGMWWNRKSGGVSTTSLPSLPGPDLGPPSPPITRPSSPVSMPTSPGVDANTEVSHACAQDEIALLISLSFRRNRSSLLLLLKLPTLVITPRRSD